MTTLCTLAALVAVLVLLPLLVLLWATESPQQRIRRLSRYGYSQRRIAEQLRCTRYCVRQALVVA